MPRLALAALLAVAALGASACGGESPAGDEAEIAFVSTRDGDYALFAMRADGTGQERLTGNDKAASVLDARVFFQTEPAWSPDGLRLVFMSRREGRAHLFIMSADGSETRRLTSGAHDDHTPAWSPDGRFIAFSRDGGLSIVRPDGTGLRRVTPEGGEEIDPTWSPDGKWIAYVYGGPGVGAHEVWRVRPDGSNREPLTRLGAGSYTPAWSPDGSRIAFASNANDGRYQLYVIGAGGKGLKRLTFKPGDYFNPSWSPDGTILAFAHEGRISTRTTDGVEREITDGPFDSGPAWRPARLER